MIWPVMRVLILVGIAGVVGMALAGKIVRPFQLCSAEGREERRIAREIETLSKENAALERQIDYLKTPRGVAEAARKLGYVKPGEIMLVIPEEVPGGQAPNKRPR